MKKSDTQIRKEATQKEYNRVFENMNLPAKSIFAKCSNGVWKKEVWQSGHVFGWGEWEKV